MKRMTAAALLLLLGCAALTGCGDASSDISSAAEPTAPLTETTAAPAPIAEKDDYIGKWVMEYRGEPDADNASYFLKTWWGVSFPSYGEFMNLDLRADGTYLWEDELWNNRAESTWDYNADGTVSLDFPGDEIFGNTGGRGTATCTMTDDGKMYFHWMVENLISDISFHAVYVRTEDDFYDDEASLGYAAAKESLAGFWIPDAVTASSYSQEDRTLTRQSQEPYDKDDADAWYYDADASLHGLKIAFSDDGTFTLSRANADGSVQTAPGHIVYNADGICYYTAESSDGDENGFSESGIFILSGDTLSYIRADAAKSSGGIVQCIEVSLKGVTEDRYDAYDMNTVLCP